MKAILIAFSVIVLLGLHCIFINDLKHQVIKLELDKAEVGTQLVEIKKEMKLLDYQIDVLTESLR